jgi:hypothetical protein
VFINSLTQPSFTSQISSSNFQKSIDFFHATESQIKVKFPNIHIRKNSIDILVTQLIENGNYSQTKHMEIFLEANLKFKFNMYILGFPKEHSTHNFSEYLVIYSLYFMKKNYGFYFRYLSEISTNLI